MEQTIQSIFQTFEGLIRRQFAPSMTFFAIVVLGEFIRAALTGEPAGAWFKDFRGYLEGEGKPSVFITLFILLAIGLSYALGAIQQLLFDDMLKRNFDPTTRFSRSVVSEARALTELRAKVKQRLVEEEAVGDLRNLQEASDYVLYEILGGIDPTDTYRFVDAAKATGIVCVSVILVLLGHVLVYFEELGTWVAPLLLLAVLFYWWGREAALSQYRARALRLYVNFLAMPTARITRRLLRPDEDPTLTSQDK
ncbi:hypothetical protein [Myxococcus sp. RHSTA-1-4]|uniref:hypothetical protein n=1 Tax=Myxococcus sp. RHSTA-1-4 TaxID=2874601 RepID=UPI001CBCD63B|nr:hypothetical protein [Myxococcus sp. RHSTA-1-4]MBZ4420232.1 hypothetical protein [Myxococcus sp. RHSTA-1-4]